MHCANLRRAPRAIAAALILAIGLTTAHSQTTRNPDLTRIRAEIERLRKRLDDVRSQTRSAEHDLEEADLELGIRTNELQLAIDMQSQLEQQQHEIEAQISSIASGMAREKDFLRKRLATLYRLGGLSYIRLLLSIDDRRDPVQAVSMLSFLVSRDARAVSRFQAAREELRARSAELADRQQKLAGVRLIVEQRQRSTAVARAKKERMLTSLRSEGNQSEQKLAELEEKARRLEHLLSVLSRQNGAAVAAIDIRTVQGALAWPVQGKIIEGFGKQRNAKFSTVTFNNGLKIAAAAGTEVRSVFAGTVLFSQWFKGYGNLVILDHGNRVFSLYGNLKSPAVAIGDRINAGQALAGVGESEDAHSGYLYFEIRQDNKPEDPQKWLR
ncbi:MAG TPA: peptidoglycan DD-metalloendopeptidase family protein [Thermoanaerobaculia bacterium]|jgi:septal ring factor EnvC (AmiA/AmiB activator)|nr:peptidoglycan DD-metalloendopeptidase family protein [Thermoanaerobaculia bacterium]